MRLDTIIYLKAFAYVAIALLSFYLLLEARFYKSRSWASPSLSKKTLRSLAFTNEQCQETFPGLFDEVDRSIGQGSFAANQLSGYHPGTIQVRIHDGKLYVLFVEKHDTGRVMLIQRSAILHALHRAIVTAPSSEHVPNTTLTLSVNDNPRLNALSFSRSASAPTSDDGGNTNWLMPHYSSWSYAPTVATLDSALTAIDHVEENIPWSAKIDRAVWRGTVWFNPIGNPELRKNLLAATRGKEWADVSSMKDTSQPGRVINTALELEDFCRYKYIIYTDGITYSGRLPFHQACASVLITPPPLHMMHTTHLLRPVYAAELLGRSGNAVKHSAWPSYSMEEANVVFVRPDWTDLEDVVLWLGDHQNVARAIARRARNVVVKGGYLSPAAETCYWRALMRGWSKMVRLEGKWVEGTRWEVFSVTGTLDDQG